MPQQETELPLSGRELEVVRRIAQRDGVTLDEAATRLMAEGLASRVRRRTGKAPAKVYAMRRGK